MNDSIDSSNFSVTDYLPLICKESITHMHGLAVYVKGFPFARDVENSTDSYIYMLSTGFTSVLLIFPPSITLVVMQGF